MEEDSISQTENKPIPVRGRLQAERDIKYQKDFEIINDVLKIDTATASRNAMTKLTNILISADSIVNVPNEIFENIASKFAKRYDIDAFHQSVISSLTLICQKNLGYSIILSKFSFVNTLIEIIQNIENLNFQFDEVATAITYLSLENQELFGKLDEGYVFELLNHINHNNFDFILTAIALFVSSKFLTSMSEDLIKELTKFSKSVLYKDHKMRTKRIIDASCIYSRIIELRSENKFAACEEVKADESLSNLIPLISEGDMSLSESILIMYTAVTNNEVVCKELIQIDRELQEKIRTLQGGLCTALLQAGFIDTIFKDIFYNEINKRTEYAHQLLFTVFSNILVCPNLTANINSLVLNEHLINRVESALSTNNAPLIVSALRFSMILIYKAGKELVREKHMPSHPEGGVDYEAAPMQFIIKKELIAARFARMTSLYEKTSSFIELNFSIDITMYSIAILYHLMTLPQEQIIQSDYSIDSLAEIVFSEPAIEAAHSVLDSDEEEFHHIAAVILDLYENL